MQINSVCGIGSTGRIATDIHQVLKEEGHESYIAFGRYEPKNCGNVIRIGTNRDVYRHVALTRVFDKHGFGSRGATNAFLRQVEKLNPDVIHLHNIHGYYLNVELLFDYLKVVNKPIIWTLHDCWTFTGHCSHFDYISCDKWKTGCFDCPQKGEYPKSVLFDNSRENFIRKKTAFTGVKNLTIVTPSQWLAGLVGVSFLRDYPVKVINNGIDLSVFKPTPNDFRQRYFLENKFIILGVANIWTEKKGLSHFLQLSRKLKPDEEIVLVGLSHETKSLPQQVTAVSRTDNIRDLAAIYSAADVYLNFTFEEVMGLTNVESLACGTPVITYDSGGSVECIDSCSGIIVEKGNIQSAYRAIQTVKNCEKENTLSQCVQRAEQYYNKRDRYCDYIKVYSERLS